MGYKMLKNTLQKKADGNYEDRLLFYKHANNELEQHALHFLEVACENLRFEEGKRTLILDENQELDEDGRSIKANQIPYNMQMDIDRLCLVNALRRFLRSGKKEDAFDIYFCYLEMFIGEYDSTRRMIELLSEFETNASSLLMKHRDHYSHSVYVFSLGLAIFDSNTRFREAYKNHYNLKSDNQAARHFLEFWGLSSLFHDIGYPFELPFEQVASYFELHGDSRKERPFLAYNHLESYISLHDTIKEDLKELYPDSNFTNSNEVFAKELSDKLGRIYHFSEEDMLQTLKYKPTHPGQFGFFMDHAYFSATVLLKKLFMEMNLKINRGYMDALTAILMHNSLYKFSIAKYKESGNKPLTMNLHPLAYLLMLCDELQCWDRTSYGRNSRRELHPMDCSFLFDDNKIHATYLYDKREDIKIKNFIKTYKIWSENQKEEAAPKLKAYSNMYIEDENHLSSFQKDIESIVDLSELDFKVETDTKYINSSDKQTYLSSSNFINLYHFAIVLNARWSNNDKWQASKEEGHEEEFLFNEENIKNFTQSFKELSLEYKLSNINQAKGFAKYLNEINCFYTDKEVDFELVESFSADELLKIGLLEHQRWLQEHYDMGWSYGEPKDKKEREFERIHIDMIPDYEHNLGTIDMDTAKRNYQRLDKEEQDKDTKPMECMLSLLKMYDGLRIFRLK